MDLNWKSRLNYGDGWEINIRVTKYNTVLNCIMQSLKPLMACSS